MIKIEFKEVMPTILDGDISNQTFDLFLDRIVSYSGNKFFTSKIKSVTFGCPSELVPSRESVLKQLGITKVQDDAFQAKYSIEHVKPTDL